MDKMRIPKFNESYCRALFFIKNLYYFKMMILKKF